MERMDINKRVEVGLALQRYLRAVERFEHASAEFNESCQKVRECLPKLSRFVTSINHQMHLVESDEDGNFNIKEMDLL